MGGRIIRQYIVDAFTDHVFGGNPAAVCVLDQWLPQEMMMYIAGENNLSETAFWILYCIQEREKEAFTQREICDYWFYTPQTVNSALKNMTEEGLLILRTEKDNRKNKRIYLTEKGKETVERIVVPLMDAERRALAAIGEQEAEIFLKTMKKHTEFFREEIEELIRQGDPA